ncbi:MAG: hypothetical protein DIZ80_12880 [endosymbiont of Galathealinum brachiosum]|uniref:Methyltransferase domain-containing protein n=1 Tax=endosymbiont of Galathealinum brachiosum TaxID=2200906 RepID=A0A370D7U3_9GAMM|nr:MAG: hypothetical protein DIZ80_12880 [endosymbiont of Galathealinum brachiosum]
MANIKPKELKAINQARTLISQNNALAAKESLLAYSAKSKLSPYGGYILCLSHALLGEFNHSKTLALQLLKKDPQNIDTLKLLGSSYHELRDYSAASKAFTKAVNINNQDITALSNLAGALKEEGKLEEAEKYFTSSLQVKRAQPAALTNYGLLKQMTGNLNEAILLHQEALNYDNQNLTMIYNLAFALSEQGSFDQSLEIYEQILKITPQNIRAICDVSQIYIKQKRLDEALSLLDNAKSINSNDEHIHLNMGVIYKLKDQFENAEISLREALRINPNNSTAQYYLSIVTGDTSIQSSPEDYVTDLFDGYAETFDEQLVGELQYKTPTLIGELVNKYISTDRKYNILDLGCGTGLAGIHFADVSEKMVGIDLSPKMLNKAKDRNIYDELLATDIEKYFNTYDFKPDIVISADVFVYIGDIDSIFSCVSNAMNEGGIFAFSTEDTTDTDSFRLKDSGRFSHSETYISALAKKYNFSIAEQKATTIRHEAGKPIQGKIYILQN